MQEGSRDSKPAMAKERRVESLGWLTESSIMPKKQRAIAGVGASSIVELRAQLYRSQEDAKRAKEGGAELDIHRSRKKSDLFSRSNAGVEERSTKDKLQFKAENDGSASYAALEKKAQLYEKLVRGELPDEEEKEKYSVDFLRKGFSEEEFEEMASDRLVERTSSDDTRQEEGFGTSSLEKRRGIGWSSNEMTGFSQEHKQLVREVNEETKEAREKASHLKQRRQVQAEKNREKLRQAFIKKKLEKLKAAVKEEKQNVLPNVEDENLQGAASNLCEVVKREAD